MTDIKNCDCSHPYQDREYGPARRVMNLVNKDAERRTWRCTVCGKDRVVVGAKKEKKK